MAYPIGHCRVLASLSSRSFQTRCVCTYTVGAMYNTTGILSKDVRSPHTSVGQYLREQFPNVKPLREEYKSLAHDLVVDSKGAHAGNIGTAFDAIVKLTLNPDETPPSALMRFLGDLNYHQVVNELANIVGHSDDRELVGRAAWGLALCVIAYRAGPAAPQIPNLVYSGDFTVDTMLEQADDAAVEELAKLKTVADKHLFPEIANSFVLEPSFDYSAQINAEADLITEGLLLDIKTSLATKNTAGARPDTLKSTDIYQLLGYVLFDYSNKHNINRIGLYSARYGTLVTWPLEHVLNLASGRDFSVQAGRQDIRNILQKDAS